MDETLKKINDLLKNFNNTFEISANIIIEDGEEIANGLKINNIKNDGSEFMTELFDMFRLIIQAVSTDHELIYNEEKGLVIAKKIVKVDYVIEE